MSDAKAFDLNRREHVRKDSGVTATVMVGDAVCKCKVEAKLAAILRDIEDLRETPFPSAA
ncbi:MAG: hypothetical protein VW268_01985 [Rhodospirillaceae bacterium]